MNRNFWKSKKVLVTGHTGFKGSWLCLWLSELGAEVIGYSLEPPTEPNLFTLANVESGITSIHGDVRDSETLTSVVEKNNIEIIVHLAAQSLVKMSYRNPVDTYSSNVMGTVNVLEAARNIKSVRCVLNVTSDKCYENKEWDWGYRECDRLGGNDPYSNSKACSELVTMAYRKSFLDQQRVAVATARAGNVIGGGDWALDRLIPDIMRAVIANNKVRIRNPDAIRPWQHVLEPISGYLILVEAMWNECEGSSDAWNFGPTSEDARPVHWLLGKIEKTMGMSLGWEREKSEIKHYETHCLKLDSSKAQSRLGWKPMLGIDQAIDWTVEWYKKYINKEDMDQTTVKQIREYEKLL